MMGYQPRFDPAPLPTRLDAAKAAFARQDFIGPDEVDAFEHQVKELLADGTADQTVGFIGFVPAKPRDALQSATPPWATVPGPAEYPVGGLQPVRSIGKPENR